MFHLLPEIESRGKAGSICSDSNDFLNIESRALAVTNIEMYMFIKISLFYFQASIWESVELSKCCNIHMQLCIAFHI